jgi:ABC-type polysaccharide/polyol phosphate transport system ATPase subunit
VNSLTNYKDLPETIRATDPAGAAILLHNVSVRYKVPAERIDTIKEQLIRRIRGHRTEYHEFWALRNLDLRVPRGEALGLIGRNGAGKSTLLKVIARVLHPTSGRVQIAGSVAPLIELGTGFSPELTGRENIYLNGSMLGFSRAEMDEKLDHIIEFSELAPFIDSPLRTYSSGMIMRLGFSIAVDVEPDILLVDEILAVGDAGFQEKCTRRMKEFREKGTTIVFVSHSLDSLRKLCDLAVWVDKGQARYAGHIDNVIERYKDSIDEKPRLWSGTTLPEEQTNPFRSTIFSDLPDQLPKNARWMIPWIEKSYLNGITTECDTEPLRYCPQRSLTHAELAVYLLRARHWPHPVSLEAAPGHFEDIPDALSGDDKWMAPWIDQLQSEGIAPLSPGDRIYRPAKPVTRAELAVFLLKARYGPDYTPPAAEGIFADVPARIPTEMRWMAPWAEQLYRDGITAGCSSQPLLKYCPERAVTRAEIAVFLLRLFDVGD